MMDAIQFASAEVFGKWFVICIKSDRKSQNPKAL